MREQVALDVVAGQANPSPGRPALRRRLMHHVRVTEDCWNWRTQTARAQPRMRVGDRQYQATHVAWYVAYGEWPLLSRRTMLVAQQCGNRLCVRPRHLAILDLGEVLRLRSARLDLSQERLCEVCERPMHVRRWLFSRGLGRYCSRRCFRAFAA